MIIHKLWLFTMLKEKNTFIISTSIMMIAQTAKLIIGIIISIIVARYLGPENQGIYSYIMIFSTLMVSIISIGIGPATTYFVAKNEYDIKEILGNNIIYSIIISNIAIIIGIILIKYYSKILFNNIPQKYLYLSLLIIPIQILNIYITSIILGKQKIKTYNYIQVIQSVFLLLFITIAILFKEKTEGIIIATIFASALTVILSFIKTIEITKGVKFTLNNQYYKNSIKYGIQAHLSNILAMLNYRIDIFIINWFLTPVSIGFYTIAVTIVERLWMISQAASTVLFPKVAAENNKEKLKKFTPKVVKNVTFITTIAAILIALFSYWLIIILYSKTYISSVAVLRALLVGIVALSADRIMANDISGRGYPMINTYRGIITVIINIALNILWIPKYGIVGAAWASSVSYTASFLTALYFYCRLSGNRWQDVVLFQRDDWLEYKYLIINIYKKFLKNKITN